MCSECTFGRIALKCVSFIFISRKFFILLRAHTSKNSLRENLAVLSFIIIAICVLALNHTLFVTEHFHTLFFTFCHLFILKHYILSPTIGLHQSKVFFLTYIIHHLISQRVWKQFIEDLGCVSISSLASLGRESVYRVHEFGHW